MRTIYPVTNRWTTRIGNRSVS